MYVRFYQFLYGKKQPAGGYQIISTMNSLQIFDLKALLLKDERWKMIEKLIWLTGVEIANCNIATSQHKPIHMRWELARLWGSLCF